jgi:hypothetical protein
MKLHASAYAMIAALVIGAAVFTVGVSGPSGIIMAQEKKAETKPIRAGDYVTLGPWRRFQLTTASFVRPELYKAAEVAFAYDTSDVVKEASPELIRAMSDGKLWLGFEMDGEPLRVGYPTDAQERLFNLVISNDALADDKFVAWLNYENAQAHQKGMTMKLVSSDGALLGLKPQDAYLSWSPKEPVAIHRVATTIDTDPSSTPVPNNEEQRN